MPSIKIIINALLLCLALSAQAQSFVLDLRHGPSEWHLPAQLQHQWLAPQAGLDALDEAAWQAWTKPSISLVNQTQALWLRIPLQLDASRPWRVVSEWPQMGDIAAFWQASSGHVTALSLESGWRYPVFALPAETGQGVLLLRVHYPQIAVLPLRLLTEQALQDSRATQHAWLGLFFGIGVAVVLYNLFLWVSTQVTLYLWYVLFQLAAYTFEAIRFGLHEPWLGPLSSSSGFILSAGLSFLLVNVFSAVLLSVPRLAPRLWRFYRALMALFAVFIAALLTPLGPWVMWLALPLASVGTLMPLVAFYQVRTEHHRYLWLYGASWALLIAGTLLFNLALMGVLPINQLTSYAQLFGLSTEALLLSFLLGLRLSDLRRQRAEMAEELLQVKSQANEHLQAEVARKTQRLNQALRELQQAHQALNEKAIRDPLTGQFNRRFFDDTLSRELQRAARENSTLTLALIDIDHFKPFNDNHGHLVGDDCLRSVAQCLAEQLRRPEDVLARYGGEEFAMILPATPDSGAQALLQATRQAVEQLAFCVDGQRLPVTVSIGYVCVAGGEPSAVIAAADQHLYAAKAAGRNRVMGAASAAVAP
ncbi:diguanylate cyclase [Atopomonas hussainii]|uniref:diguanylate cyclase n=1 Tax=Atopomonas hussainii TaxID=1429083 RepID=A0A1H7N6T2_9GAMM|nr:diguanylate cyclase [Atopomonas hussainii]SEL19011.1 diguanylate cyclase [Atopomonas hussainii]